MDVLKVSNELMNLALSSATAIALSAGLLALSAIPFAAAEPVCTEEDEG